QMRVTTAYDLGGNSPGSMRSDLSENVKIDNLTANVLNIHFFQYVDFDLNGSAAGDIAQILGGNTARQTKGSIVMSETVATPHPNHYEVNVFNSTLSSLNDGGPTTLNDNAGPSGPNDMTWAFQWDFSIPVGGTVNISKDKSLVPEPASLGLMLIGGVLVS